jgi:hypothetical protein
MRTTIRLDGAAFGLSELVLSGFLRIATHPRVVASPSALDDAFVEQLRNQPNRVPACRSPRPPPHLRAPPQHVRHEGATWSPTPASRRRNRERLRVDHYRSGFQSFPRLEWRHPLQP